MPVILRTTGNTDAVTDEAVESALYTQTGDLTLDGQIIEAFLDRVDYSDMFEGEDVEDHVEAYEAFLTKQEDGTFVESETAPQGYELGDERDDVDFVVVEGIPGEVVAQIIDEEDLVNMFAYHVEHLPEDTMTDRVTKKRAQELLEAGPWAKGEFRRERGKGAKGKDKVTRMLLAMLHKKVIKRADAPGTGYQKGDYEKHKAGYKSYPVIKGHKYNGVKAAVKNWLKYKGANAASIAKAARAAKSDGETDAAAIKAAAKGQTKKKPTAKDVKASAKAKLDAAKAKKGAAKKANSGAGKLVAHDTDAVSNMSEGVRLAHGALSGMGALNETATNAEA